MTPTTNSLTPLLELALAQTNGQGAYVYRFDPAEPVAALAAWAGMPAEGIGWRDLKTPGRDRQRSSAIVIQERAWADWRFESLPEFRKHRFEGVVSIPVQDSGEVVGIANFCRSRAAALPPRELSFLLSLSLPLGALLNSETLRDRLARTTQQLADRKLLARAKGLLQAHLGWTEEEAYLHIRRISRQRRTPLRVIAQELIASAEVSVS